MYRNSLVWSWSATGVSASRRWGGAEVGGVGWGGGGGRVLASVRLLCLVPGILMQQVPQSVSLKCSLTLANLCYPLYCCTAQCTMWPLNRRGVCGGLKQLAQFLPAMHMLFCKLTGCQWSYSLKEEYSRTSLPRNFQKFPRFHAGPVKAHWHYV